MIDIQTTDIEQKALELFPVKEKLNKKGTGSYDANLPRRKAWIEGVEFIAAQFEEMTCESLSGWIVGGKWFADAISLPEPIRSPYTIYVKKTRVMRMP